tara:strand:+ start:3155 stop:3898 length:744 start_codon:yes stop_codon:yes gene_type:complete
MYHGLGDNPNGIYNIDKETFLKQMKMLKDYGFVVESFQKYWQRMKKGKIPKKYILLTFDDGYKSFLWANDILLKLKFSGTFFITKKNCNVNQSSLDNIDLIELGKEMEIGSHSLSHPNLTKLDHKMKYYELDDSKKWLEDLLGKNIFSFSAPGGYIDQNIIDIAENIGYRFIGNSNEWYNTYYRFKDFQIINRISMRSHYDLKTFKRIIFSENFFLIKRQIRNSGINLIKKIIPEKQIITLRKKIYF